MSDVDTKPEVKKPVISTRREAPLHKLKQTRLHQGEAKMRVWFASVEEGTPYEALFDPVYWDVHAYRFAVGDFIRVEPDEGHYTADLRVTGVGVGGVRVAEYYKKDWAKVDAPASLLSQYRVKYAGPHHRYRVERIADNGIEQANFESEAAANAWLSANLKALTIAASKAA
jgi:hypothetical protein